MNRPPKLSLLADPKAFNKFCVRENNLYGCRDAFMCSVSCPLFRAKFVEYLVNYKGMTLGEAHRSAVRQAIEETDAKKILKEAVMNAHPQAIRRDYPERPPVVEKEEADD